MQCFDQHRLQLLFQTVAQIHGLFANRCSITFAWTPLAHVGIIVTVVAVAGLVLGVVSVDGTGRCGVHFLFQAQ